MIIAINVGLIILFCYISSISYYYDQKKGIIPNKSLLIVGTIAIILKIIDYKCIDIIMIQLIVAGSCSWIFYLLHIWAGGDTKLFFVEAVLMPNILYIQNRLAIFQVLIISYSLVYIYLIIDSLYAFIRKNHIYKKSSLKNIDIKSFIINWLLIFLLSIDIQKILHYSLRTFYIHNYIAFIFGNIFLILIMKDIFIKVGNKLKIRLLVLLLIVFTVFLFLLPIDLKFDLKNIFIVINIIILREWANRYNYTKIKISDLKKGMILSASSVVLFLNSNIEGLPMKVSEDMAARLTDEEVKSIKEWSKTKKGRNELIIVKKIPFAFFINIGYLIFMIIGGYKLWLGI